jgi:hypothetical protein
MNELVNIATSVSFIVGWTALVGLLTVKSEKGRAEREHW